MTKKTSLKVFDGTRVLITGHTGFKGSWLSLWLSELGAEVYGLSLGIPTNPSHYECAQLSQRVNDYRVDIRDSETVKSYLNKIQPDFVFHLAAQPLVSEAYKDPINTWETNTMGTINILESLRDIDYKCVAIFITTDKCYDNFEWVWGYRETDRIGGRDPYSASKGAAEIAISSYVRSFFPSNGPVRLGIGRAGNVIGGGDWSESRLIPDCIRASSNQELVKLRNPDSTRPWQHVLEPLSGYIDLALKLNLDDHLHGEAFNFAAFQDRNYTVVELVKAMSKYWSNISWTDSSISDQSPYESQLLLLNCDKAKSLLKWRSVWDFDTTIMKTVQWYRHFYENGSESMQQISLDDINDYVECARSKDVEWSL